ncbi:glucan 1,4-alpha-maltohydrolase [Lactiplantibacillus plantarum]|nr:glucan 1,4-alpha-maltohydrolase [Lactiplantibacillus plantarum]
MHNQDVVQENWRMWKHGKQWLYASSAVLAMGIGMGLSTTTVQADTLSNTQTTTTAVQSVAKPATTTTTGTTNAEQSGTVAETDQVPSIDPAADQPTKTDVAISQTPAATSTLTGEKDLQSSLETKTNQSTSSTKSVAVPEVAKTNPVVTSEKAKTATPKNSQVETPAPVTQPVSAPAQVDTKTNQSTSSTKSVAVPEVAKTNPVVTSEKAKTATPKNSQVETPAPVTQPVSASAQVDTKTETTAPVPVKDTTKVIIHYQGDSSKWAPYVWGLKPNGNGQQYDWTGTDDFGAYAEIDMDQNYQQLGVLIKGVDSWDKDGNGADRTVTVDDNGKGEAWYRAGSDDAQDVTPTYHDTTINVHYHDKNQSAVNRYRVWTDKAGEAGAQTVDLNQTDANGNLLGTVQLTAADFTTVYVQPVGADELTRAFTPVASDAATDIYVVAGDQQPYYTASFALQQEMVTSAAMQTPTEVTVTIGKALTAAEARQQLSVAGHTVKDVTAIAPDATGRSEQFKLTTTTDLDIMTTNSVSFNGNAKVMDIGDYVRSQAFDNEYYYDGDDPGVTYSKQRTQIKLWAPTANQIELRLYQQHTADAAVTKTIAMQRGAKGVWTAVLPGDYQGWAYDYQLHFGDGSVTTTEDPYSKAVTVNGNRSVIADVDAVKPADFDRLPSFSDPTDAVIYETSVRDFTKDPNSGVTAKGKFTGMVESGTHTASGQATGLDYLKDLGVTHVQLMPMYDFASIDETSADPSYNWGYDPKNYNVPEGTYSSDASDPTARVLEMKEMVNGYHKAGIRVVMDVVYNHVYSMDEQAFQKVVPGYYFQYDQGGHPTSGSGVGNDVASERRMVRKYILDSVKYWATEYNIDGFRFDLMGILDVDTMNAIRAELNAIDPGILVYGEGWDMRVTNHDIGAGQYNADKLDQHVGFFSGDIRNAIKGAEFGGISKGLVEGNAQEDDYDQHAQAFIAGFLGGQDYANAATAHPYQSPSQTLNYVACHDNRTLYDMLTALMPNESQANLIKRDKLATSMAFLAEGVPFVYGGQESLRTKGGDENSYQSPDAVNQIDWDRVQDNQELVDYFEQLVQLRKDESAFRLTNYADIDKTVKVLQDGKNGVFAFEYLAGGHKLYVLFNVNDSAQAFDAVNLTNGRVLLGSDAVTLGTVTNLAALSTLVVREDLPQTVTLNYQDDNGQLVKTTTVTLTAAGTAYTLTAPAGYHLTGDQTTVSYDFDNDGTARIVTVLVAKMTTDNGQPGGQPSGGNGQTGDHHGKENGQTGATTQPGGGSTTTTAEDQLAGEVENPTTPTTTANQATSSATKATLTPTTAAKAGRAAATGLPQTDERAGQSASLLGLLGIMLAGLMSLVKPQRKRN